MDEILNKYRDRFNENFPVMLFMGMSEEDLIRVIQKCLDEGVPYELPDCDGSIVC